MSHDFQSGTYKISGHLIFVKQSVFVAAVHVQDVTQTVSMLSNSSLVEGNLAIYYDNGTNFNVHPTNPIKCKTCFRLFHKWKRYRTSWPVKDVTEFYSPT
jgi:hypothetical protein